MLPADRPRRIDRIEHRDAANQWCMRRAAPANSLRGMIGPYTDYSECTQGFTARREPASTEVVMIVNLDEAIELVGADGVTIRIGAGEGFVAGIADHYSISRSNGRQSGIQVHLDWAGLSALCGAPASCFANRVVSLSDALGRAAQELGERLLCARDHERRFDILDAFLLARMARARQADPAIRQAVATMRSRPRLPIAELAEKAGWSSRHFIHRFRQETGHTPGQYGRLLRFERFTALLKADPQASLAELAADAGYCDQPHLNREAGMLAGETPAALRRRLVAAGSGFVEG